MDANVSQVNFGSPSEGEHESPEMDFLRAACAAGEWDPSHWMLSKSMFSPYVNDLGGTLSHAWSFIDEYFDTEAKTPPWDLVVAKYPALEAVEYELPLTMALKNLHIALHEDVMRKQALNISRAVESGSQQAIDSALQATQALREQHAVNPWVNGAGVDGRDLFGDTVFNADENLLETESSKPMFRTENKTLNFALGGGFHAGSLNLVGALPGVGKSMWLAQRAVEAAEQGLNVCIFSLEMSSREYSKRMHNMILGCDATSVDADERVEAIQRWYKSVSGEIRFARTDVVVTPRDVLNRLETNDVVIVDYAGLMTSGKGENHAESHNAAAQVANELMSSVQKFNGNDRDHLACLLVAVQLSKLAVVPKGIAAVGKNLRAIADSMAYSRNSHTLTTLHREGLPANLRLVAVEKNRNSESIAPWYENFRPDIGDFEVVEAEAARAAIQRAEEKEYDV